MSVTWTPVADRVFVALLEPHRVNVGLIVGDDGAMLVDTGNTAEQGAEVRSSAEEFAGVPVTHVVLTHDHHDHVGGLAGVRAAGEVSVVAHENLTSVEVTRALVVAVSLDLGAQRVEIINFGSAHTDSDVVVFVPAASTVFVGDLLEEGADPQFDERTALGNWPTFLDGILGATTASTVFVPGHGAAVDRDFAFIQRAELSMLYSQAEMLIEQGVQLDDAAAAAEWPFGADTIAAALPLAYKELALKGVTPKRQLPIFGV
jgi:glyoxylase-like metal-dependent hydrolase (beta-lactamase superfamily II)